MSYPRGLESWSVAESCHCSVQCHKKALAARWHRGLLSRKWTDTVSGPWWGPPPCPQLSTQLICPGLPHDDNHNNALYNVHHTRSRHRPAHRWQPHTLRGFTSWPGKADVPELRILCFVRTRFLHDLWCHHSWLWLSLGLERRVYTLLTPGLWLLLISTSDGPDLTLRQLGPVTDTPSGTLDMIKRTMLVWWSNGFCPIICVMWQEEPSQWQWCVARLSQAAVAGQARRGCQSHRSRSAVRSETESVRVRVSTNLRSKMAAACDLVRGDHGV